MGIGLRLKIALRERKTTIKDFSTESGISINTLYSITKRDSEKIDNVTLSIISETLGLSWAFFCSCPPFEDLDFLNRNKTSILSQLEEYGSFARNGRDLESVGNYELWQQISNNVGDITAREDGSALVIFSHAYDTDSSSRSDPLPVRQAMRKTFRPNETFYGGNLIVDKVAPANNGMTEVTFSINPSGMKLTDLVDLLDYLQKNNLTGDGVSELMEFVKAAYGNTKKDDN